MKKINLFTLFTLIALLGLFQSNTNAQTTIAQWTFPTENGMADGGIYPNNNRFIETAGGTSEIDFKNGATTKAARATAWNNGADAKMWTIHIQTEAWTELKLSSKISSGGENPGPRDFKVQYKLDNGSWTDIENSDFQTANDWTTGVLHELALPFECGDQTSVKIRWIMTSDTAVDGSVVNENGISKIDDIFVTGVYLLEIEKTDLNNQLKVFPNPASDFIQIQNESNIQIALFDFSGRQLLNIQTKNNQTIDVSEFKSGTYLLSIKNLETQSIVSKTIIIQ